MGSIQWIFCHSRLACTQAKIIQTRFPFLTGSAWDCCSLHKLGFTHSSIGTRHKARWTHGRAQFEISRCAIGTLQKTLLINACRSRWALQKWFRITRNFRPNATSLGFRKSWRTQLNALQIGIALICIPDGTRLLAFSVRAHRVGRRARHGFI